MHSFDEERYVCHTSELAPEGFDFGVERFCSGIGRAVYEEIQYCIVVITECFGNRAKLPALHFVNLVVPSG